MISSPSRSSTPTNSTDENLLRCVTPSSSSIIEYISNGEEDDEDDIPHMLNPYSENDDDDDLNHPHYGKHHHHPDVDDHHDDDHDYMEISPSKPITYRADSPQHWRLPISNGYDIVDSSPVSSISNFSYDQNTQTQKCSNMSNQIMDITSSPRAFNRKDGIQPRLRPRIDLMGHGHSSPDHHHHHPNVHVIPSSPSNNSLNRKISTLRTSSPTNSLGSKGSPRRNTINGTTIRHHRRKGSREANRSDRLPPPSPRRLSSTDTRKKKIHSNHRRSVSFNQIDGHTMLMAGQQHRRVHSQGNDDTRQSPKSDHRKNSAARSTKRVTQSSIPPKYPMIHNHTNTHRRTVSFPDHVLQNNGYTSTTVTTTTTANIGNVSPLTLQSDDPALFSLLETTQSSRNGRVYIPNDVDPTIYIPSMNTIRSISPPPIAINRKDSKNHHYNTMSTNMSTTTPNKSLDNIHQITFDPLVMNPRHYIKKHRRGKSSSGSFSSCENKLASLEEERVFQSDDVTAAVFVEGHRKIDASISVRTPPPQVSYTIKEIQRNTSKHQGKLKDGNNINLVCTESSNDSFFDKGNDGNANPSIFRKKKIPRSKKKEKKTKKNLDDIVPIGINDSMEKENYAIGEAFVEEMKTSKKNKEQCSIQ